MGVEAARELDVHAALSGLEDAVVGLTASVQALEKRLEIVCSMPTPGGEEKAPPRPATTGLGQRIRQIEESVRRVAATVRALQDKVEV